GVAGLFDFGCGLLGWAIVGDSGCEDGDGAGRKAFNDGAMHVVSRTHIDALIASGCVERGWSSDEKNLGAALGSGFGYRIAHFAGRAIGDVADRVEVFAGRTSGDEHGIALQIALRLQHFVHGGDDSFLSGETSGASHSASEI